MDHRPRTSSHRESVGLRQHNSSSSIEERVTLTNPASLFPGRSNSTASIATDTDTVTRTGNDDLVDSNQKIIFQTTPRRSSISNISLDDINDAKLIYNTSYGGKMEFSLSKDEISLGRREDNDIVLSDVKISKRHALIVKNNNIHHLIDTKSSNGVRLNDNLIEPNRQYALKHNDEIMIGQISLLYRAANQQEPANNSVSTQENNYLKLVTILPSERKYEETVTIRAEVEAEEDVGFIKIDKVEDVETLREDYEKLRMAYELSKMSVTDDINKLLSKSLDMMFEILPLDRGVVLLVDHTTGFLSQHYVKLRPGLANEKREILLSSTILYKVFYSRKVLVTSDAMEDPMLGKAASVRHGQIRSVICVPLIAHNKVYGILHLDSRERINSYSNKDISLIKAIGNQTAMVIENMNLMKEVEAKVKITEQLSRFLPPHVVDKMTSRSAQMIQKGGREMTGTVVFADIRGFTNLSEKLSPQEVVYLLNEFFERLVKIVFKYDGVVDKYIGDCIMSCFGTLEDEVDAEYRAVRAGIEFQKAVRDMNEERVRARKDPIEIGVGINTAARICDFTEAEKVYISESTYELVKDRIHCQPIGYHQFKGKVNEVMVYDAISVKQSRP
ncbi:hypothetical protein HDV02_001176 [Globomyces sp. JEL0801]|nr:hypothetical protein HDV02_001176 [Globomyces sp. JEL0801]